MKRFLLLALLMSCAAPHSASAQNAALSIGDAGIYEGNSTYRELAFSVSLSAALPYDVSASYATKPITAVANSDYTPHSAGQIVIRAGQTRADIIVRVLGDGIEERDEKFLVQLSRPKRASLADGDGIGSIRDDDYNGQISISDTSLAEGNANQKLARVEVSLSSAPLHEIEVRYEAKDDSAISRQDYLPTRGSLFFNPGRRVLTIAVPILGDRDAESDEKFGVSIVASPYNPVLNIVKALGTITLKNDDAAPTPTPIAASIGDIEGFETFTSKAGALFTMTLAQPATREIAISYQTQDRTATAPGDYLATGGVVRFAVGATRATIAIPVVNDLVEEAAETFAVRISAPEGISGDSEALALIQDEDYRGELAVASGARVEGNSGESTVRFAVALFPAPAFPLEFRFATRDGTATAGSDYLARTGSLFFTPEITQVFVELKILGDTVFEDDEEFFLFVNSVLLPLQGQSSITIDNDDAPSLASNGKIAFESTRDGNREIYVMNGDGTNQTRLTFDGASDATPGLSPDGGKIAFISNRSGVDAVWVMNADGSGLRKIFEPGHLALRSPRFSPNGNSIALAGKNATSATGILVVIGADGTGPRAIADRVYFDSQLGFSPDGTKITFASLLATDFYPKIAVINLDGSGRTQLTADIFYGESDRKYIPDLDPTFSRDGTTIAFSYFSLDGDIFSIKTVGVSGTPNLFLGNINGGRAPSYSPEGNQIAYSMPKNNQIVAMLSSDGSNKRLLTANGSNPSWSVGSVAPLLPTQASKKSSAGHS